MAKSSEKIPVVDWFAMNALFIFSSASPINPDADPVEDAQRGWGVASARDVKSLLDKHLHKTMWIDATKLKAQLRLFESHVATPGNANRRLNNLLASIDRIKQMKKVDLS